MIVLIHNDQPLEKWREGVMTRMRMSALLGGKQMCIFDQFCDPGLGAPGPPSCGRGSARGDRRYRRNLAWEGGRYPQANQSVLVPAGAWLSQPREHNVAYACHVSGSDL